MTDPAGIRTIASVRPKDAVFSADGTALYTASGNTLTAYSVATGVVTGSWTIGTKLGGLGVTADGKYLVSAEQQITTYSSAPAHYTQTISAYAVDLTLGTVQTYSSTYSFESLGPYATADLEIDEGTVLGNGKYFMSGDGGQGKGNSPGRGHILDLTTGTFSDGPSGASINVAVTSANGMRTLLSETHYVGTTTKILDSDGNVLVSKSGIGGDIGAISGAAGAVAIYSADNSPYFTSTALSVFDLNLDLKVNLTAAHDEWNGQVAGLAFSPDGSALYLLDASRDTVYQLSTLDYSVVRAIELGHPVSPATAGNRAFGDILQINKTGTVLSVISDDGLELVDLQAAPNVMPVQYGSAAADDLTATAARPIVYGEGGDDVLRDGGVAATLYGGFGQNIYYVTNAGTSIGTPNSRSYSTDTVRTTLSTYQAPGSINRVEYIGTGSVTLTAAPMADRVMRYGGQTLVGGAGNDILYGTARDTVIGGAGNDVLYGFDVTGGAGDDYMQSLYDYGDPSSWAGTATFDASLRTSTILFNGRYDYTIISHEGTDRAVNFTTLRFSEQTLRTWHLYDIEQLYETWGGRAASNDELVYWTNQMDQSGRTLADIRTTILNDQLGQAHMSATITALYKEYGGRAPTGSEQAVWANQIRAGADFDTVRLAILGDPLGAAHTKDTATAFYSSYFHHSPNAAELAGWDGLLRAGYDVTGAQIATMYQDFGGRLPQAGELSAWEAQFALGANAATVRGAILNDPLALTGISSVYQEYAGRSAQPDEQSAWLAQLRAGMTLSNVRDAVLNDPIGHAHTAQQLDLLYKEYGGRAATADEVTAWDAQLHKGASFADVRSAILADPLGQNYANVRINALYVEYGGRSATSAELSAWKGQLQAGSTYQTVRTAILDDPLGQNYVASKVTALYQQFMGRAASADEIAVWKGLVRGGADFTWMTDALMSDAGSIGHVQRATGTAAADSFTYAGSFGNVGIYDFDPLHDILDLRGSTFAGANPLDAAHAHQLTAFDGSTDVLLTFDATDHILLHNVSLAQLSSSNFLI